MLSCFGIRKSRAEEEREPLLPRYEDDTSLQRQLHQKLHSYQMFRALSEGYMPSNEQAIVNLRTLMAAEVLNPEDEDLSDSGRALVYFTKQWLKQFIELLQHKNSENQIQDFIWYLTKARIDIDMEDIIERTSKAKAKADTAAAYRSLQTVGSLLLTNSDFRLFLSDLNTVGREVFRDTAFSLAEVSREVGKKVEPSQAEQAAVKKPGADAEVPVSRETLAEEAAEISDVLAQGAKEVAQEAGQSIQAKMDGDEKATMLHRLKQVVANLRQRRDYSDAVSTLSLLVKRYGTVYAHVMKDAMQAVDEDVDRNSETDRALRNFWSLLKSFGEQKEWQELEARFNTVMGHGKTDPEFDKLVRQIGDSVQELLTDPSFFDHAEQRFQELRQKSRQLASDSSLREDIDGFLAQLQTTMQSVSRDKDISTLMVTGTRIAKILSPAHSYTNGALLTDAIHVFVPQLVKAIQYVPIPRIEVSTPQIDLLLENLILEPGTTINHSSFLPYKLRIETYNDFEIRKARFRTTSAVKSLVNIKIDGLSIRADEIGFWLRAHSGLLRLADEGIASFQLDERGIDVQINVEVGKDSMEKVLTLNSVHVHIHKLNYSLRRSKFAVLAWLLKPVLKPLIRKAMEVRIASAVAEALHFANRELLYARERLRATRIADPEDLWTFIRAVTSRLVPPEDPDLYARVGVSQPGKGVFKGVYAPGSIVKLWNEEAAQAAQRVRESEREAWRSDIFDVHTMPA